MIITARDDVVGLPSEVEIRAALDRIVASLYFRGSPRLASFLSFVVEATLAGQADRIKGYSIAVGALGRNDSFDPQTNPIVRVEAGRLRRALERYYTGSGRLDQIVIDLPCGSYVPMFSHRAIVQRPQALDVYGRRLIPRTMRRRFRLVVFVACVAAGVSVTFDLAMTLAQWAVAPGICRQATIGEETKAGLTTSFEHRASADSR